MKILSRNDQAGRSMVEMLGVLAIIGVLSVGGISGYSKAMGKFKLTKAQDQITMLLMNVRTAYATSPSYSGFNSQMAADYNIAPADMIVGGGSSLGGAFGGEVHVSAVGSRDSYFYITMRALGKEACRSLASSDWGADGLVYMQVGKDGSYAAPADTDVDNVCASTTTYTADGGKYCATAMPLSLGEAGGVCGSDLSFITWVYY